MAELYISCSVVKNNPHIDDLLAHTLNLRHLPAITGLVPRKPQESTGVTSSDRA